MHLLSLAPRLLQSCCSLPWPGVACEDIGRYFHSVAGLRLRARCL